MKTLLSWSSGKDCGWALHQLQRDSDIEVVGIFTTLNAAYDRVAMHGVRHQVLKAQADALGLPVSVIDLPWPCSNDDYAVRMAAFIDEQKTGGVEAMAFGDLFLEDIRRYREENLKGTGMTPLFPLWDKVAKRGTAHLAAEMIDGGLKAYVATVDPKRLREDFAGRAYDHTFLSDLPADVDPCGENGEFHTLVVDGPMFRRPVDVQVGARVVRDGFVFSDFTLQS